MLRLDFNVLVCTSTSSSTDIMRYYYIFGLDLSGRREPGSDFSSHHDIDAGLELLGLVHYADERSVLVRLRKFLPLCVQYQMLQLG